MKRKSQKPKCPNKPKKKISKKFLKGVAVGAIGYAVLKSLFKD